VSKLFFSFSQLLAAIYFIANFIDLRRFDWTFSANRFWFSVGEIQRKYRITNEFSCLIFMAVLIEGTRLTTVISAQPYGFWGLKCV